ncbi:hypothetical protein FR483_n134L [Paramecium bursaria Chlorella virus FR483]|uniref:Uncharacterized protein n134L n=1 Tax=Paramecium bursaria Chlorella virus FR483 TaxID=399781 RepID=A7J6I8_PBCVF|nr:hypothetical protein FR483_n134L [Paramecium bursaria Chlorella virus FR483]ABT15419.1 hypothetical protein FR483_n134L [Paramecium bursaria Chlorella virus FR483]
MSCRSATHLFLQEQRTCLKPIISSSDIVASCNNLTKIIMCKKECSPLSTPQTVAGSTRLSRQSCMFHSWQT